MRNQFIAELKSLSSRRSDTFLVVGDLGYGVIEPFQQAFPERFLNAGVAEQSMISIAAGIASQGLTVFAYSIANFPTFRALEQVRNDVVGHRLPVTIVSIGAGLAYGALGYTHHAIEDLAIMRSLSGLDIYSPGDAAELTAVMPEILSRKRPAYLRLGKGGEPKIHDSQRSNPELGVTVSGSKEADLIVLSTGAIGSSVALSLQLLSKTFAGRTQHLSIPILGSIQSLVEVFSNATGIVTVEEHISAGGLGSLVLETLSLEKLAVPVWRIGVKSDALHKVGNHDYLLQQHGLDPPSLAAEMQKFFEYLGCK